MDHPEGYSRFFDYPDQPEKITRSSIDFNSIPLVSLEEAVQPLVDQIPSLDQMLQLVQRKYSQSTSNLSRDESASILLYTLEWTSKETSFYYIFNRKLSSNDSSELESWYLYMKLFATSLSKLPKTTRRIFYRAVPFDLHDCYPKKSRLIAYDYISCSSSLEFFDRQKFAWNSSNRCMVFAIFSQHAIDLGEHSFYPLKETFLLPANQQYQVISCRTSNDGLCLVVLKEIAGQWIDRTSIDENEYRSLRNQLIKCEKNSEITLRNQYLTDDHMKSIVQYAIEEKTCTWLSLENNRITSYGLATLVQGLTDNQTLQSLHLSQNLLDDVGIEDLTTILVNRWNNLTFLNLNHNRIGNDGARYLADALKDNHILLDLWLAYNQIGNDGAQALAEVLTFDNTTLIQLYLYGNSSIDDLCIYSIIRLLGSNVVLNTIWLSHCGFTEQGKEVLMEPPKARSNLDFDV